MRSNKFFIACAALAGAGILLATAGIAAGGLVTGIQLNSTGLHVFAPQLVEKSGKALYEEKEERLEPFDQIEADIEYTDIRLEASDTDAYAISYCVGTDTGIRYETKDGKLLLRQGTSALSSGPSWFHNISWFSFGSAQMFSDAEQKKEFITVYVPKNKKFNSITLQSDSGNAAFEAIWADSLTIASDYGNVNLKQIQAGKLETDMDSGNLKLQDVTGETGSFENEYGDITINGLELSGDLKIAMDSGNIEFEDTKLRTLRLDSTYSSIRIRQSAFQNMHLSLESEDCTLSDTAFQTCRIQSAYGNVRMELKEPAASYGYKLKTEYGAISIDGQDMGEAYSSLEQDSDKQIEVQCESGDIDIASVPVTH